MRSDFILERALTRRRFIAATAITAGAAAVSLGIGPCDPRLIRKIQQDKSPQAPQHTVWVWQFSSDGGLSAIASALSGTGLGVVVKTHDGTDWMSTYDTSPDAITGAARVATVAQYFESHNVPFHAWCVPKGVDPLKEAAMANDVLNAGARSLVLDVEGSSGFWVGSPDDAQRYGDELRRLSPYGRVDLSIDPRPWRINMVPMTQFVGMTDAIWPQLYWDTFNTPGNADGYTSSGYPPPANTITPEFLLDTTQAVLAPYNRDIIPVGQGAAEDPTTWPRFAHHAWDLKWFMVSDWRFGVTATQILQYLSTNPPGPEPKAPPATATPTASSTASPTASRTGTRTPNPTTTTPTRTPSATRTPLPSTATSTPLPATSTTTPIPTP
jgi:hypothetical protein